MMQQTDWLIPMITDFLNTTLPTLERKTIDGMLASRLRISEKAPFCDTIERP